MELADALLNLTAGLQLWNAIIEDICDDKIYPQIKDDYKKI